MADNFARLYEALFEKSLVEPGTHEDVKNILSCIRTRNGYLDSEDEAQLQQSSKALREKMRFMSKNSRDVLAEFTTAISSQLYADPFHFLHELIQNADDASYTKALSLDTPPCIASYIREKEFVVDLNEDGFTLDDVIAVCSTGRSSKSKDAATTGEKGFGFKSVFGIAKDVHIQSGLWSFAFRHERHQDGIGMVSPSWEEPKLLPDGVRTRFILKYAFDDDYTLTDLCDHVERQPATIVGFLRSIKRIKIALENVLGRKKEIVFEMLAAVKAGDVRLAETVDGQLRVHHFRSWIHTIEGMPARPGRTKTSSEVVLRFPVRDHIQCEPLIDPQGQHVFAYLPIHQIPQLTFIIQADFMLPASRQDIIDNPWNRKLREGVAMLFAMCAAQFAGQVEYSLRYEWLRFVPNTSLAGFWQSFPTLIRENLKIRKPFLDRLGAFRGASEVRLVPNRFLHDGEPLLPAPVARYTYLSQHYRAVNYAILGNLGVQTLSSREILDAVRDDAASTLPKLRATPLEDAWHDTYASLLNNLVNEEGTDRGLKARTRLRDYRIVPVRNGDALEWWNLSSYKVYFPVLIDNKSGNNHIRVLMPTDVKLPVVHPDAAANAVRLNFYHILGVQNCAEDVLCNSVKDAEKSRKARSHDDVLAHWEILFWYSRGSDHMAYISTEASTIAVPSTLFFQSTREYDAEKAVDLRGSDTKRKNLLATKIQNSKMCSIVRGNKKWHEWLEVVAGIRWFPPLRNCTVSSSELHWTFQTILKENPDLFVSMLQAHWSEEYAAICRSDSLIKETVRDVLIPCIGEGKQKLKSASFPTKEILDMVQLYGVEKEMGIVKLPGSEEGTSLDNWSSLRDLGISSVIDLNLYKKILLALATGQQAISFNIILMVDLYRRIGNSAPFKEQEELQDLFTQQKLIWDPKSSSWRSIGECVWNSKISLTQKFIITSSYDTTAVQYLFKNILKIGDSTAKDLINELEQLRVLGSPKSDVLNSGRASQIYKLLEEMATSPETKKELRTVFKTQSLIHCQGQWYESGKCVWHESVDVGGHIPIKANFPSLQEFFTTILGISTVSDTFMMRELAKAAKNPQKKWNAIKKLMLDTSAMLTYESPVETFTDSIEMLKGAKFLPCKMSAGDLVYLTTADNFFIPDDETYKQAFQNQLYMLDFTYSEMNKLHNLIRLLGIEGRYLCRNVQHQTEEGDFSTDDNLTARFRQCAYAISCCAVYHRSPFYFNHNIHMHDLLQNVAVATSPNMQTVFSVMQRNEAVKVTADKVSLVLKRGPDSLQIILPKAKNDQISCLRAELPKRLAKELGLSEGIAVSQIYRLINEMDRGTDQLLEEEGIPHTDEWLSKTERVTRASEPDVPIPINNAVTSPQSQHVNVPAHLNGIVYVDQDEVEVHVTSSQTTVAQHRYRQVWLTIPAEVDYRVEAPEYWRVLDHVRRQAVGVKWRNVSREQTSTTTNDHVRFIQGLRSSQGNSIESSRYPELFGSDNFVNFRIGAAGELFAFEILKSLLGTKFNRDHWPSKIRHYVRANRDFADISRWTQPETADLTYSDDDSYDLEGCLNRRSVGDDFDDWLPHWLHGTASCEGSNEAGRCLLRNCTKCPAGDWDPLEWLFEVKTTIGPCETAFFMSQSQYSRMRNAGQANGEARRQVYCIVRVYDLLKETIGVRIFIDPWRFRDNKLDFSTTDKWRVKTT